MISEQDHLALSRLALGDLPPDEAAALFERIEREPELAEAWAVMVALPEQLEGLVEPPPPALQSAVLDRVAPTPAVPVPASPPANRGAWWRVGVALAAGLLLGVMLQPEPDRPVVALQPGASQMVLEDVQVVAGDVRVTVDGQARISWEPSASGERATSRNPEEEGGDVKQAVLGAGAGAFLTVAVLQGTAWIESEPGSAVQVEEGEDVRVSTRAVRERPSEAARQPDVSGPSVASQTSGQPELQAEVKRLTMENELLRGQLELMEGVEQRWPENVPVLFQEDAVRAGFEQSLGDRGEVLSVDCDEYPCIVFADLDPSMGSFEDNTDVLKAGLAQTHGMDVEGLYVANLEHEDGRAVQIAGIAFYPPGVEPGDEAWTRTHSRAKAELDDLMEDHPVLRDE